MRPKLEMVPKSPNSARNGIIKARGGGGYADEISHGNNRESGDSGAFPAKVGSCRSRHGARTTTSFVGILGINLDERVPNHVKADTSIGSEQEVEATGEEDKAGQKG